MGALVALGRFLGGQGGGSCLGVEGTGRQLECLWGSWWVLWAGAEECGRWNDGIIDAVILVTCLVAV